MDVKILNEQLSLGFIDNKHMWPRITEYESRYIQFPFDFGLNKLPLESGILIIRGPRQYGKSTWLELEIKKTILEFGRASAFYLNGDYLASHQDLEQAILQLLPMFNQKTVKRLFIDEITAIIGWEKCLKRLWDRGEIKDLLIITTGSKAFDLRRGSEKLPGRKGKLIQNEYIFLPLSYKHFHSKCNSKFGKKTWIAYLMTGGSMVFANDLFKFDKIQESSIQLIKDWVLGDIVSTGRSRIFLSNILSCLIKFGSSPVGYAKLAREAGISNNTVAAGYIDQLFDLLTILPSWQWDESRKILLGSKPCKFHFINLAMLIAFHPNMIRSVEEFCQMPQETQGVWIEWLMAQEIWRKTVLKYKYDQAEKIAFWKTKNNEIDFVLPDETFIEVKRGKAGPMDFTWFPRIFPHANLKVICQNSFEINNIKGMSIEEFLLE